MDNKKGQSKKPPNILPKSLQDYYLARTNDKAVEYEQFFDGVTYSESTEMNEARREIACLDNKLVKARGEWMADKKLLDIRWKNCTERYNKCYEDIPKFNGYYKDSFAKRERAFQTLLREQIGCKDKERDIRRLQKEIACLKQIRADEEIRLEKFSIFKTYLTKVQETSKGEYTDIRELIDRYSTLSEARTIYIDRNDEIRDLTRKRQKTEDGDIVMYANEILAYRNFLSELLEYKDAIQEEAQRLEDSLYRIKSTAAQRTKVIGQIRMSIDNLYRQVCKYMHRPPRLPPSDTIGQIADIGISVKEMSKLSRNIKQLLRTAFAVSEAEKSERLRERKKEEERQRRIDKYSKKGAGNLRDLLQIDLPPLRDHIYDSLHDITLLDSEAPHQ